MTARTNRACGAAALLLVLLAGCSSGQKDASSATAATPGAADATATAPHLADAGTAPARVDAAQAAKAVPCTARDVVLKPANNNADLNGMNHTGVHLTLTNKSRNACSIPGQPELGFLDGNGPVKTVADLPGARFMHPGPQVVPLVLQPKQSVTATARWVSGAAFQDNLCYKLTGVTLALRDSAAMAPLVGQMCGERSQGVHFELQRYTTGAQQ